MTNGSDSEPSQAVRLFWVLLTLTTPFAAIGYVLMSTGAPYGGKVDLVRVLLILVASVVVNIVCAIWSPVMVRREADGARLMRVGHAGLGFAVSVVGLAAIGNPYAAMTNTYPVLGIALAGMFFCYAIWAYTFRLVHLR